MCIHGGLLVWRRSQEMWISRCLCEVVGLLGMLEGLGRVGRKGLDGWRDECRCSGFRQREALG